MRILSTVLFSGILTFISFSVLAASPSFTLVPIQSNTDRQLVTLGLPFAPGQLLSHQHVRIYDEQGNEQTLFTKPTLTWHFKPQGLDTVRAVQVQFYAASSDQPQSYQFTYHSLRPDDFNQAAVPIELGLHTSPDSTKANTQVPNLISVVDADWLVQSQLIPSYLPQREDNHKAYWDSQFNWTKTLNYSRSNIANWLFDRVTALYKGCMRSEDPLCYQEAFQSYDYWMKSLKRDGGLKDCLGGSLMAGSIKACDTKYTYIEQIKIHLALTGDDRLHDNDFVRALAELSRDQHYYQAKVDIPYETPEQAFTERASGLSLLAQLAAYEITADETILDNILLRLGILYEHQLFNPDSLPADGSWRHSWTRHEGGIYRGLVADDRRFSPWMMENLVDALWQVHHVIDDVRIADMLLNAAQAIEHWGFATSDGYQQAFGASLHDLDGGARWYHGCNRNGLVTMYSASSVASDSALIQTQNSEGWYSDGHNPQMVLPLALGMYFSDDATEKKRFSDRIQMIEQGYLNAQCGEISSTPRKFNWNHRSNAWGTYLWVVQENAQIRHNLVSVYAPDFPGLSSDSELEPGAQDEDVLLDDFGYRRLEWKSEKGWQIIFSELGVENSGLFPLSHALGTDFELSMSLHNPEGSNGLAGLVVNTDDDGFYSVRVKTGPWGAVYLYRHEASWDIGGKHLMRKDLAITQADFVSLRVKVKEQRLTVSLDDELMFETDIDLPVSPLGHGVLVVTPNKGLRLDNFKALTTN